MDFEETSDDNFSEANFEMNVSDLVENNANMDSPVFDSDTDELLIKVDEKIMNGEDVQIPMVSELNEYEDKEILSPPKKHQNVTCFSILTRD